MERYYSNEVLLKMLQKLEVEQIQQIDKEFTQKYPESREFSHLCYLALGLKESERRKNEFVALIEQFKNTPPDAATSSEVK